MTMNTQSALARLTRQVPQAEQDIDQALISLSSLLTTMVTARRDTETGGLNSQVAVQQVSRAIEELVSASNEMARAHGSLSKIAVEKGVGDMTECPKWKNSDTQDKIAA
ncbi:MAG: hypothetical protein RLZZ136_815 [Pseudomonadota bacterium]|jgi:hypothetical protein